MYLFGGLMLWGAFVLNIGPDIGWFAYTPLSGPQFSPGKRADVWAQMITFTEVSALSAAVVLDLHDPQDPSARHDAGAHAAVRLGDAGPA